MTATLDTERERIRTALAQHRTDVEYRAELTARHRERMAQRSAPNAPHYSARDRSISRDIAGARARADGRLSGVALYDACRAATHSARVPAVAREDVIQALALTVLERFNGLPRASELERYALRMRAHAIYCREAERHERATGRAATAEHLSGLKREDRDALADTGGSDVIWQLAAGLPVVDTDREALTAERIAAKLKSGGVVTHLQADAVRIALSSERNRPLSESERALFSRATAILRKRWHTESAVRIALRSDTYATRALVDRAIEVEARRADIASRMGTGCTARNPWQGASGALRAHWATRQAEPYRESRGYGGPVTDALLASDQGRIMLGSGWRAEVAGNDVGRRERCLPDLVLGEGRRHDSP